MRKHLKSGRVVLYDALGKTAFVGLTDTNGVFAINDLASGVYRLDVSGWGTTTIRLNPELDMRSNGQVPLWSIQLLDNECVSFSEVLN
jgi:hypothetical protein